jgi:hypothetical protein
MAIKKILDDFQSALSIAQAGIKGALESLRKTRIKANKRTTRKRTPRAKPMTRSKKKRPAKKPTDPNIRARSVIEGAIGESLTPKKLRKPKIRQNKV